MINDPDFAIGPSYLMTRRVADPNGLERIWKTAILPLIAEHYFGEGRDTEREFGLPALRRALERETAVGPSDGDGADVPPDEVEMSADV
jgi:5-methylcytosine-specific restriction protein B